MFVLQFMMELQRPGLHSAYMGRQVTIYLLGKGSKKKKKKVVIFPLRGGAFRFRLFPTFFFFFLNPSLIDIVIVIVIIR